VKIHIYYYTAFSGKCQGVYFRKSSKRLFCVDIAEYWRQNLKYKSDISFYIGRQFCKKYTRDLPRRDISARSNYKRKAVNIR